MAAFLAAALPVRAANRFQTTLDDATRVDVVSISSLSVAQVQNLVRLADRSTRTACPVQGPAKGLMRTGDQVVVTNNYMAWFDYTELDGVFFPPPFLEKWERSGALTGWWTLNPSTGTFRYPKVGPQGCAGWAPNELIPGSSSLDNSAFKHWWDRHAPPNEFAINIATGGSGDCNPNNPLPRCYMAHHFSRGAAASNWTATRTGEDDAAGIHYRTRARMANHPFPNLHLPSVVDFTDLDDTIVSAYIESDVEYIAQDDVMYVLWRFRPVGRDIGGRPINVLWWTSFAQDEDWTGCDQGGGEEWPSIEQVYRRPLYTQSTLRLERAFDGGGQFAPGTILPITLGTACTNDNWTLFTRPNGAVGDYSTIRVGEAPDLSNAGARWQLENRGVPGIGSGSEADPIRLHWEKLMTINEVDDGATSFGAISQDEDTVLADGKWYVAAFSLKTTGFSGSGCPPSPPTTNGPQGTVNDPRPFFSWTSEGSFLYEVRVKRQDGSVVVDQTGINTTFFTPPSALPSGVPLTWQVRRETGCGNHDYSAPKSFQVGSGQSCPPNQEPLPIEPVGTVATLRPTFRWTSVPGATGGYTLFALDPGDNFVVEVHGHPSTQFTPANNLPAGIPLRWKVAGQCPNGLAGPYGERNFQISTSVCEPLTAPVPVAPYGTVTTARPTFQWQAVPGATSYTVLVQNGDDVGAPVVTQTVSGTSWTPTVDLPAAARDRLLRWKVKVEGPCQLARYSLIAYFYVRTAASPTVTITGPVQGSTVPESVPVQATVSGPVQRVEFYVDGVLKSTDTAAPYEFTWDTTLNPLPPLAPGRGVHLGYAFSEWQDTATFDATRAEVNGYTDTYIASLATYLPGTPSQWIPNLAASLDDAVAERKWIHLTVDMANPTYAPYWDQVLETARTRWPNVLRIEIARESEASPEQMQAWAQQVRDWIGSRGLNVPPQGLGATAGYTQPVPAWRNAVGIDWVGIQAFLVPPGGSVPLENVEQLLRQLGVPLAEVPSSKKIVLFPMASNRDSTWTDYVRLRDIQLPSYTVAQMNDRVIGIDPIAYARPGGTRDIPDLKTPHRVMAERILGVPYPGAANGPHSLHVKAVTSTAADARYGNARVGVYVQNRLFFDMPVDHGARTSVEAVWNAGISEVCGADAQGRATFCPDLPIQRRHVARWLIKAREGILYRPPAATGAYLDVPSDDAPWVEEAVRRNLLQPVTPTTFDPNGSVTRGQMAVSVLRATDGPGYAPPPCVTPVFQDVPCSDRLGAWVNELYRRGITTGCSPGFYCANDIVSRWMMAIFVDRAF